MKKLKMGIVGLGRGAGVGAMLREQSKLIEVTAICDIDEERLLNVVKKFGGADAGVAAANGNAGTAFEGETYISYDEMLQNADMEAVYLATPIPTHADMVVQALNAGKHVVSEVICATTLEDCTRIQKAIQKSGKKYLMAEQYCFLRPWSIIINMVKAGLFGEIFYAEGNYSMDFTQRPGYPYVGGWRQNVYHMHRGHVYITHSLGPLAMLFNEDLKYVSSMGSGSYPRHWGLRADNTTVLTIQTESRKLIHLKQDFLSPRPSDFLYYAFQGTKGGFEGSHSYNGPFVREIQKMDQKVYIHGQGEPGKWRDLEEFADEFLPDYWKNIPAEWFDNGYNGGTVPIFEMFADAVLNNTPVPLSPEETLNWTAAGICSEMSSDQNGVPVEIPVYHD
ncbi:MAG: Gfo/Idh/MocA family oxidoreductase [Lentisphaeria bacterium]|nr:Gfo/Idh/MocA family oxidoreductase [Lentisphaeria bacterium]